MEFIKTKFPTAINYRKAIHYQNKTLAVDTSSAIYKFLVKTISIFYLTKLFQNKKLTFPLIQWGTRLAI